eukprot:6168776-Prymnesium_polylepis.1
MHGLDLYKVSRRTVCAEPLHAIHELHNVRVRDGFRALVFPVSTFVTLEHTRQIREPDPRDAPCLVGRIAHVRLAVHVELDHVQWHPGRIGADRGAGLRPDGRAWRRGETLT